MSEEEAKTGTDGVSEEGPLDPKKVETEVELEFYRASGPGGQRRNKVETAVRLKHLPTGIVVTCCDERSQARNREIAMKRLMELLEKRRIKPRRRIKTKKPRSIKKANVEKKRKHGEKKKQRTEAKKKDPSEW